MYDGLYTRKQFALEQQYTIENFPISLREVPVGEQGACYFHEHDTIELAFVTAGHGEHLLNGQRTVIKEGDVLVIYPGLRHGYDECETLGLFNIMYDPAKLPFPILDGGKIPLFRRFFPHQMETDSLPHSPEPILHFPTREGMEKVLAEVRILHHELSSRQPGNMMVSIIKLLDIILSTLRIAAPQVKEVKEKRSYSLEKILEYLNKNFTQEIALDKLIKMSFYSKRVFQYKFKELTGYSVTEYVLRKRIALAQELLRKNEDFSIGEVAVQCAFLDQNYFSRKFREITGTAPRNYRRASN